MRTAAVGVASIVILITGRGSEPRPSGAVRVIDEIGGSFSEFSLGDPPRAADRLYPRAGGDQLRRTSVQHPAACGIPVRGGTERRRRLRRGAGPQHAPEWHRGSYGIDDFPQCTVRVRADRYVWFGQDPIRSITLSTVGL